jgi:WD40 repeat protein
MQQLLLFLVSLAKEDGLSLREVGQYGTRGPSCEALAFSADNRLAFSEGSEIHILKIPEQGTSMLPYDLAPIVVALRYSSDGKHVISAGGDGVIVSWDVVAGKQEFKIEGPSRAKDLALCDGEKKIGVLFKKSVVFYDRTGKQLDSFDSPRFPLAIACSPCGVCGVTGAKTIMILRKEKKPVEFEAHRCLNAEGITGITFSPDGKFFATCGPDYHARLWRTATLENESSFAHEAMPTGLAFSPDGKLLATICNGDARESGWVVFWNIVSQKIVAKVRAPGGPVNQIAFSPDGRYFAAGMRPPANRPVALWELTRSSPKK